MPVLSVTKQCCKMFYYDSCAIIACARLCSNIDGLVQERRNSSALAMELRLFCTNPLIWWPSLYDGHHSITMIWNFHRIWIVTGRNSSEMDSRNRNKMCHPSSEKTNDCKAVYAGDSTLPCPMPNDKSGMYSLWGELYYMLKGPKDTTNSKTQ